MAIVAAAAPVPVLTLWDYDLGSGALGGRVVTASTQGRAAAAITARILDGQAPSTIPITEGPSQAIVDDIILKRWNISERRLPRGTRVLNRPTSAYERHKLLFWAAGVALTVLLPASLVLLLMARREARLAERRRERDSQHEGRQQTC